MGKWGGFDGEEERVRMEVTEKLNGKKWSGLEREGKSKYGS